MDVSEGSACADSRTNGRGHPSDRPNHAERWQLAWSLRDQLFRVARHRTLSEDDAQDVVQEAILRAGSADPSLADERLPAWLTLVTLRLCVDAHRARARELRCWQRAPASPPGPPIADQVSERDFANWIASRAAELPPRQQQALRLKAQGLDVHDVASHLGVSYRTAESLLARGRRALRMLILPAAAGFGWISRHWLRPIWPAPAVAALAMGLSLVLLPYVPDMPGTTARPPVADSAGATGSAAAARSGYASPYPARTPAERDATSPSAEASDHPPSDRSPGAPQLPKLSPPSLQAPLMQVPQVQSPELDTPYLEAPHPEAPPIPEPPATPAP